MTDCKLESDDCCISCKACGYEILEKINKAQQLIRFDLKNGIKDYPAEGVYSVLEVIRVMIDD